MMIAEVCGTWFDMVVICVGLVVIGSIVITALIFG